MKRKILSLALCMALFSAALCTGVQATGMGEFQKQRTYSGQFHDITGKWHETYIADLYEYGLAEGMGENTMEPDQPVTVAQVIALAARINAKYYDGTIGQAGGGEWYEPYISYAYDYGLIDRNKPVEAERLATREESVIIFSRTLPDWQLGVVNETREFVDVRKDTECSRAVDMLYRAGVVSGYDDGLFRPKGMISRAEAMTIADKMVNSGQRHSSGAASGASGSGNNKWTPSAASGTFFSQGIAMINTDVEKGEFMMAVTASLDGGMLTLSGVCEIWEDLNGNITVTCVVKDRVAQGGAGMYATNQAEKTTVMVFSYDGDRKLTLDEVMSDGKLINGSTPGRNNVLGLLSIGTELTLAN